MAWNTEWLNENSSRAYPFKEDMILTDIAKAIRIPNNLIVDLCLVAPADFEALFYLSRIVYSGTTITLTLSVVGGGEFASISINSSTHVTNTAYNIIGQAAMDDVRGRITLGDLSGISTQLMQGVFDFDTESTLFEARAVRPDLRGVRTIRVIKADGTVGESLYGALQLVEGLNIKLTYVPATNGIRIDSLATDLETTCLCDASQIKPPPIRTINSVPADSGGNFTLEALEECLEIAPGSNKLTLTDKCAKPCCGCSELTFITQQMAILKTSAAALEARAAQLQAAEINFYNNVLGTLAAGV